MADVRIQIVLQISVCTQTLRLKPIVKILVRRCRKLTELVSLVARACEDFKGKTRESSEPGISPMDFNRLDVTCGERIISSDNLLISLSASSQAFNHRGA